MKLSNLNSKQWTADNSQQEQHRKQERTRKKNGQLSKREIEVLQLVAKGLTASEVAEHLYISLDTIETHKKNIVKKLAARNTVDAVVKAVRNRII